MINLHVFTKSDWYGFGGAEPFADGSDPLTGEFGAVDSDGATLAVIAILDANGLALMAYTDEGEERFTCFFAPSFGARAVALLHEGVSFDVLRAMPGAEVERAQEAA